MRTSFATLIVVGALAALVGLGITDHVMPATDPRADSIRSWVAARALGVTAYLLLTIQVGIGVLLSHPRNAGDPRTSKVIFPWHELLTVFTVAFLAMHIVLLAIDPYAGVGWIGAFVPGFSGYRTAGVAVGSVSLYALLIAAITAKWTRLLPAGWWLKIHRLTAFVFLGAWVHGVLSGTDTDALLPMYLVTGGLVLAAVAHRWWSVSTRSQRAAGLTDATAIPPRRPAPASATEES